ncbi:MAG: Gfo/Idh/MocA family oxidoreductase [Propionivibrio sp.]
MIGVAILGIGSIAETHLTAFQTFPDRCQVRALCDLYPEKAGKFAAAHGLDVPVYQDYREALGRGDIDLVSICLPPSEHGETAVAALEAGKHVLVEKPMAASLAECDRMIAAADTAGKLLSVVAQNRYSNPAMKLKRVIESGVAGKVLHAVANSLWWRGQSYYDLWWRGTWAKEGGGCTLNHAVHHIDLLRWMIGSPEEVTAVFTNANHDNSEVEDLSVAVLKFPGGRLGVITASLLAHGEEQELVFHAERAKLSLPWKPRACQALENGFPQDDETTEKEMQDLYDSLPDIPYAGHTGQFDNLLAAIEGREKLLIDGREGRATLELVMSIYRSAATGTTVKLPLTSDDPAYRKETLLPLMPHFHEKKKSVENFADNTITLGRNMGK